MPTCTQVSAELPEQVEMPVFQGELDLVKLQRTADLMQWHGITGDRLDVAGLVAEAVR
ncbi:hypothetical protein [Kocuria nitroreducens]|uniref:hypothetical protein n=1 Tax=Kocuria nitroreducens TaxID=3058914 RepID=UPI0036D97555